MKKRAAELFFWPGMANNIKQHVQLCDPCQIYAPSKPKQPPTAALPAAEPMDHLSADLFDAAGKPYLVIVDRFSGFPFVEKLTRTTTDAVTGRLLKIFELFGFPGSIRTDGGPQFRGPFDSFCAQYGIRHELSSPYNPQSNGHAEAAVKNTKRLLKKLDYNWEAFNKALLEWRNVPKTDTASPAELMFGGRKQRTLLPSISPSALFEPKEEEAFPLDVQVRIQDPKTKTWDLQGTVIGPRDHGGSFRVLLDDGREVLRNAKFIKLLVNE